MADNNNALVGKLPKTPNPALKKLEPLIGTWKVSGPDSDGEWRYEWMEGGFFPSLREHFTVFGMTEARLARARPDVIVMHPGPINRGVEISSEVADGPYSVILDQVANGVAARMAVLYLLAGGGAQDEAVA